MLLEASARGSMGGELKPRRRGRSRRASFLAPRQRGRGDRASCAVGGARDSTIASATTTKLHLERPPPPRFAWSPSPRFAGADEFFPVLAMRLRIRVLLTPLKKALPVPPKRREAERRKAHHGFRPAAERKACQRMRRAPSLPPANGAGSKRRRPRLSAPHRGTRRGSDPRLGSGPRFLESPDPNGRTLSGTSAASTWQSGHAPDGRCPKPPGRGLQARLREPHPPHRSAVTGRRPFDGRACLT